MVFDPRFLFPLFTTGSKPLDLTIVYDAASTPLSDQKDGEVRVTKKGRIVPGSEGGEMWSLPEGHAWTWVSHKLNRGIVHGKMMVLRRRDSMRVVVASSNLNDEWRLSREVLWVQDFPLLEDPKMDPSGSFYEDLNEICENLKVPEMTIWRLLRGVDFSGARANLIASFPGTHFYPSKYVSGHFKLRMVWLRDST